ncbi:ATPase SWSAP1 [Rhinophrynus dorsalis]
MCICMARVLLSVFQKLGSTEPCSHFTCVPQEPPAVSVSLLNPGSLGHPSHVCASSCGPKDPAHGTSECGPQETAHSNFVAWDVRDCPVLLFGPPGSGKSGLMFMAAVLAAEEGSGPVIFLSQEPLQKVPGGRREVRDPLTLKRIRFLYPRTLKEILHLLSSIHLTTPIPSLILLDGLERYLTPSCCPPDGALLSALLVDSASHLRCGLLVSAVPPSEGTDGAFLAVERYFPSRCHIYTEGSTEREEGTFRVSFLPHIQQWILHTAQDGALRMCPNAPEVQTTQRTKSGSTKSVTHPC